MTKSPIPESALEQHIFIGGKTGSGKSNAAKVIAEDLMRRGERVCAVDPTGTWWGLRLQRDGKKPSDLSPMIFGGQRGDLAIGGAHGAAIGEAIATSSTSAIIDTRTMTVSDRTRFFTDFAESLLRHNRGPLHLIIDEAHLFMPQAGAKVGGAAPAMLHAGNNLVALGRGVGLRIILISQRPAKLHKDSVTQAETLVAMRLIHPLDRRAIEDWIGEWAGPAEGKELVSSLAGLPQGDAWIWSPELGVLERSHFPLASTFDSGRPRAEAESAALAPIDIDAMAGRLEEIGKEVLENDPRHLRKRIAELERAQSDSQKHIVVDEAAIAEAERRGYESAIREGYANGHRAGIQAERDRIRDLMDDEIDQMRQLFANALGPADTVPPLRVELPPHGLSSPVAKGPPQPNPKPAPIPQPDGITKPQAKVIEALSFWRSLGFDAPTKVQLAAVARYSPKSGGFGNLLGTLRTAGLIDYPQPGTVCLTEAGTAIAPPPGVGTVRERVMSILSAPQQKILDVLIGQADTISRDDLAGMTGYSAGSGGYGNLLGSLRSLGLIDYPARGLVVAEGWLLV